MEIFQKILKVARLEIDTPSELETLKKLDSLKADLADQKQKEDEFLKGLSGLGFSEALKVYDSIKTSAENPKSMFATRLAARKAIETSEKELGLAKEKWLEDSLESETQIQRAEAALQASDAKQSPEFKRLLSFETDLKLQEAAMASLDTVHVDALRVGNLAKETLKEARKHYEAAKQMFLSDRPNHATLYLKAAREYLAHASHLWSRTLTKSISSLESLKEDIQGGATLGLATVVSGFVSGGFGWFAGSLFLGGAGLLKLSSSEKINTQNENEVLIAEAKQALEALEKDPDASFDLAGFWARREMQIYGEPQVGRKAFLERLQEDEAAYDKIWEDSSLPLDEKIAQTVQGQYRNNFLTLGTNYQDSQMRAIEVQGANCRVQLVAMNPSFFKHRKELQEAGWILGVQKFDTHRQLVLYHPGKKEVWELRSGAREKQISAPIYQPEILLHDFLETEGEESPRRVGELLIAAMDGPDQIREPKHGVGLNAYNSPYWPQPPHPTQIYHSGESAAYPNADGKDIDLSTSILPIPYRKGEGTKTRFC